MSQASRIEWTEATWNPTIGCTKISPGCKNCYAETMAKRLQAMGTPGYENGFKLTILPERLAEPLARKKPTVYFVNSMSDLFHKSVDDNYISQVFDVIRRCPQHTFQVLTKRADRMASFFRTHDVPTNAWIGVSVEDRKYGERAVALRRTQCLTYERIAQRVGLSRSAVARACKAAGVARLPALQDTVPVRRYERPSPGELLHLDTKKLGRFDKPGHRVTGDRTQNTPRAGWQTLHVAIDDHSRVGFSLMLADETAKSACAFLLAALRYYKSLGVKVERVMTDNGAAYKSRRFARLLHRLGIKHIRTRPYTPRTNGKAERFIQTLLREWAYAFIYPTSEHRTRQLQPWMHHYNFHRPHSAVSHKPPITRLGFEGNNVVRNYT